MTVEYTPQMKVKIRQRTNKIYKKNNKCVMCNRIGKTTWHHKWDEMNPENGCYVLRCDLLEVCKKCHAKIEKLGGRYYDDKK